MAEGFTRIIKKRPNLNDTLALIIDTINTYSKSEYVGTVVKELGPTSDRPAFIKRVFDFYCRVVKYKLDDKAAEIVTTPALTIHLGAGDCKKAAAFLASVYQRANIMPILKHVYYKQEPDARDIYTHIYVIVPYSSYAGGTFQLDPYITADPTNDCRYNSEVIYEKATLYFLNGKIMELQQMGAPRLFRSESMVPFSSEMSQGSLEMLGHYEDIGAAVMPTAPQHHVIIKALVPTNAKLQAAVQNIPVNSQRGAFLELIKNNVNGLASSLAQVLAKDPNGLNTIWNTVGGDLTHLKQTVLDGAKQKVQIAGPEYISGFSFKNLLHGAAAILHAVAPVANAIFPGAGAVIGNIADKAEQIATSLPVKDAHGNIVAPPLPIDTKGKNVPFGPPSHGSLMGSAGGFFFKSILLLNLYTHNSVLLIAGGVLTAGVTLLLLTKKQKDNGRFKRTH